jgi:hypothetical protein
MGAIALLAANMATAETFQCTIVNLRVNAHLVADLAKRGCPDRGTWSQAAGLSADVAPPRAMNSARASSR